MGVEVRGERDWSRAHWSRSWGVMAGARYLEVDISSGLSWNSHIDRITVKANRTPGFLKRNIKTKQSKVREVAYNTLVCPQL